MRPCRIETPQLAIGHDGPRRFTGREDGDHASAGVLVGRLGIAGLLSAVEVPIPSVGQTHGDRLFRVIRGVQAVVEFVSTGSLHGLEPQCRES